MFPENNSEFEHNIDPAGVPLLGRVQSVAQGIAARVHATIGHNLAPAPASGDSNPNRPLRVLVVDDNVDAADALAAVAELLGCEVRTSYGGIDAIDALQLELPDVLLLDLSMPVVDGLEVAARARTLASGQPILLVATTALGALEDRTATALAGFHFHLVKPIDTSTLRAALEKFRSLRRIPTPSQAMGPLPPLPAQE